MTLHPDQQIMSDNIPYTEQRPWGIYERFTLNESSTVKLIRVHPGQATSLQLHNNREENWRVISGNGTLTIGDAEMEAVPGKDYRVPPLTKHRIAAGTEELLLLEISKGEFDETDIIRLEDKYGRQDKSVLHE